MLQSFEQSNVMVLNVGYAKTKHHWGEKDFSSPFARLYYVKEGEAWLHLPDKDIAVKPGYMYLVPTFVPHSYECNPGFAFYYMFIYELYQNALAQTGAEQGVMGGFFDVYEFPIEVKANEAIDLLFTNYCNLYPQLSLPYSSADDFSNHPAYRDYATRYTQMDAYEKMQLRGMVLIISSYFMKHAVVRHEQKDDRIRKIVEFCQQNADKDITIDDLTDIACITKAHLMRIFREKMGVSPLQYIIRKKIQLAQGLLLTTDMSVRQIAARVGINDSSYFIRIFRKNIGFTPQDYRNKLK